MSFFNTHLTSSVQTLLTDNEFPAEVAGKAGSRKKVLLIWITGWERPGSQVEKPLCAGFWIWTCLNKQKELLSIFFRILYSLYKTTTKPWSDSWGWTRWKWRKKPPGKSPTRVDWGGGVRMEPGVEETWKDNCGTNSQNIGVWSIWGGKEEAKMLRRFRTQKQDKTLIP